MPETFRALLVEEAQGETRAGFRDLRDEELPQGDTLVEVAFSSLNYKDALAVTGAGKVVRRFPMVPGIDLAGRILKSSDPSFKPGDLVLATGCGLGETRWGGYAQRARVPSEWLVPLPRGLSLQEAMGLGTAGFTAMISLLILEEHGVKPDTGEVVVTGAAGGVGSLCVALLSALGYKVVASTGRLGEAGFLKSLGASEVIGRETLPSLSRPLESERWAGAIDSVGGATLAGILASASRHGCVVACGLAGDTNLKTTVFPFILRGVTLAGADSMATPMPRRRKAWERLAKEMPKPALASVMGIRPLSEIPALSQEILAGKIRGRVVVDVNA